MADLNVVAAEVQAEANAQTITLIADGSVTAGQTAMQDAPGRTKPASAVGAVEALALGIYLNNGATGQPVTIQTGGTVTLGATAAPASGVTYVVSNSSGGIAPDADITSGQFKTVLGVGVGSNQMKLGINASGVTV